jgi:YD repeat-containing protein
MRRSVLLLFICLLFFDAIAQDSNYQPYDLVPQSPEAASLGRYLDQPISKYTGLPEVKIPIYTIVYGNIKVPVELSYHAGGVRVDDVASRVGLNWTLHAGGIISRNVRGRGDFYTPTQIEPRACYYDEIPDEYFYSFGQYSGKFSFLQKSAELDGQLYTNTTVHEFNNIKIKYEVQFGPNGGIGPFPLNKFTVITPDGLVYTFDKREATVSLTTGCHFTWEGNSEAWYMTEIFDPRTNKKVLFEYLELPRINLDSKVTRKYFTSNSNIKCQNDPDYFTPCYLENWISQPKILSKITFGQGSVVFKADKPREDLPGDFAYSEIAILHKTTLLKAFALSTTYAGYSSAKSKRLILSAVRELGKNRVDVGKPPYRFQYADLQLLPERGSYQQDLFGFYNGNNATTPEPLLWLYPQLGKDAISAIWLPSLGGAQHTSGFNKDPHPFLMRYGHLKKITYPTGGWVEFDMEPGQFRYYDNNLTAGGLRIRRKLVYECADCEPRITTYDYFIPGTSISSGAINTLPKFGYMCNPVSGAFDKNAILRSTENVESTARTSGSFVGYSVVTEILDEGKTVEHYDNPAIIPDNPPFYSYSLDPVWGSVTNFRKYDNYPFYPVESQEPLRGKLTKRIKYRLDGSKVSEEVTEYQTTNTGARVFNCGEHHLDIGMPGQEDPCPPAGRAIIYTRMTFNTQYKVPRVTTTTTYNSDGSYSTVEEVNTYNILKGSLTRATNQVTTSLGNSHESYVYAFQGSDDIANYASTNNMVEVLTGIIRTEQVAPIGGFRASSSYTDFVLAPSLRVTGLKNWNKEELSNFVNYLSFDAVGNPTSSIDEKGITTSYQWNYDKQLVEAVAKNASANEFAVATFENPNVTTTGLINFSYPEASVVAGNSKTGKNHFTCGSGGGGVISISGLSSAKQYIISFSAKKSVSAGNISVTAASPIAIPATGWKNIELKVGGQTSITITGTVKFLIDDVRIAVVGSELTTFTHEPLVGVTSVSDQNGVTTTFEYDELSRLKIMRDNDQNILKRYVYNYVKNELVEQ